MNENRVQRHSIFRRAVALAATLACALGKKKCREVRLAEAVELSLTAGLSWSDCDLLDLSKTDREEPRWLALGPIVRTR